MGWGYETCLLEDTEIPPKCHFVSYYYRSEVAEVRGQWYRWTPHIETFPTIMTRKYQDMGSGLRPDRVWSGPMAMCRVPNCSSHRELSNGIWVMGVGGQ